MELNSNNLYKKAMHYYDLGDYGKAEGYIKDFIKTEKNVEKVIEVQNVYAEILLDLMRYDDAKKCVDYVLKNTEGKADLAEEREMAEEFLYIIENEL